MFTTHKRIKERTGAKDLRRFDYLQALVSEFQNAKESDSREQVLANLANFAYDPINYQYLRVLQIMELFADCIAEDEDLNGKTVEFGIGGLCNLVADPINREIAMTTEDLIKHVTRCVMSNNTESCVSAITCLILMITPENRKLIVTHSLMQNMKQLSTTDNKRIQTLVSLFIADYGHE